MYYLTITAPPNPNEMEPKVRKPRAKLILNAQGNKMFTIFFQGGFVLEKESRYNNSEGPSWRNAVLVDDERLHGLFNR